MNEIEKVVEERIMQHYELIKIEAINNLIAKYEEYDELLAENHKLFSELKLDEVLNEKMEIDDHKVEQMDTKRFIQYYKNQIELDKYLIKEIFEMGIKQGMKFPKV